MVVQHFDSGVAEAAFGNIDNALKSEVIAIGIEPGKMGERGADFGGLIEARAADHPEGKAEGEETIFELAHLERGAHQDGDLIERMAVALKLLDLLANHAGLLLRVPR